MPRPDRRIEMLTPAAAMNPHNMGYDVRECRCGTQFRCFKISLRQKCDACYTEATEEFCRNCAGTGQYITGITNEVPTGPGGICFRCRGKGFQTKADRSRNEYYDRNRWVAI